MKMAKHLFLLALIGAVAMGCGQGTTGGGELAATGTVEEAPAEPAVQEPAEEALETEVEEEAVEPEADAEEAMEETAEAVAEDVAEDAGEATAGGDQAQIEAIVANWKEGMLALDVDKATVAYSESYEDAQAGSKEEAIEWFRGIMEQGFLEGIEVSEEDMEVEVDGSEAIVGPFDVTSDAGAWTIDMYLEKEDAGWKIVSLDVY